MPCCPSCGKGGFASHEAIARHMSQLRLGCSTLSDTLIHLQEDLMLRGGWDTLQPMAVDQPKTMQEYNKPDLNENDTFEGTQGDKSLSDLSSWTQYFPGAAHAFEGGKTFLDKFDADKFRDCQKSNIYYPFTSQGEWELGSCLLHSSLSMNAINSLLSLDLGHPSVVTCQVHQLTSRIDQNSAYLISNCEGAQKMS